MSESKKTAKVSAFAQARDDAAVAAEVTVDDVLEARPTWSREEADAWLRANADAIGRVMLLSGVGEMLRRIGGADDA